VLVGAGDEAGWNCNTDRLDGLQFLAVCSLMTSCA